VFVNGASWRYRYHTAFTQRHRRRNRVGRVGQVIHGFGGV